MAPPDVAVAHHDAQLRKSEAAVLLALREWSTLSLDDIDRKWPRLVQRLILILTAAQLGAARAGAAYVPQVLGADVPAVGAVNPHGWAGVASDGRPLRWLLLSPVVHARTALGAGAPPAEAMATGGKWLELLMRTQVADAGRGATSAAITARPGIGWTRIETLPCCQRCAVLVGKWFKWSDGFERHPNCGGQHVPCAQEDHAEVAQRIQPDEIKDLTPSQRQALGDGADLSQVVNAHQGRHKGGMTTSEGTTRRGYYSHVQREVARQRGELAKEVVGRGKGGRSLTRIEKARLTPEAIYRVAASREEAIRLLKLNGYIVGDIREIARSVA